MSENEQNSVSKKRLAKRVFGEAAGRERVDRSTIVWIRTVAKDGRLVALATSKSRPADSVTSNSRGLVPREPSGK